MRPAIWKSRAAFSQQQMMDAAVACDMFDICFKFNCRHEK